MRTVSCYISVSESGQYIQRQGVGSPITPTTSTPDAPFTNAGRVHIAAGDFLIDPIRLRAASATYDQSSTGTTQIDARLHSIGGTVRNAGVITIGATGEYRQESQIPSGFLAGTTINTGTFTNAGTTNIATGVFENKKGFFSIGTVRIGAGASFTNVDSGSYVHSFYFQPFGATTTIDGNFRNIGDVQNGRVVTVSSTGVYSQVASMSCVLGAISR